jgi:hypothetical protein
MSLLRLLTASALASVCVVSAAAQLPAPPKLAPAPPASSAFSSPQSTFPKTFTFVTPKLITIPPQKNAQPPAPPDPSDLAKAQAGLAALMKKLPAKLTASNDACYTMRSYGFTPGDFQSGAPKPSTSTTCTPAHTVSFKDTTEPPAK